jgi:tRNA-2-methylthio-N6-dimethylallyladenosine synthase
VTAAPTDFSRVRQSRRDGRHEGQLLGKSPYMQSVHVIGGERLRGNIVDVKITHATLNSLTGEIITHESNSLAA